MSLYLKRLFVDVNAALAKHKSTYWHCSWGLWILLDRDTKRCYCRWNTFPRSRKSRCMVLELIKCMKNVSKLSTWNVGLCYSRYPPYLLNISSFKKNEDILIYEYFAVECSRYCVFPDSVPSFPSYHCVYFDIHKTTSSLNVCIRISWYCLVNSKKDY